MIFVSVVMMKLISYFHVNYLLRIEVLKRKNNHQSYEELIWPNNLTLKSNFFKKKKKSFKKIYIIL